MKDMRGITIRKGDHVAYPGRVGSHLWMTIGEVLSIDDSALKVKIIKTTGFSTRGSETTITKIDNVVILGGRL